jgi:hypothetical protein
MTQNRSALAEATLQTEESPQPDPALKRLDKLVGTWDLRGRTLDSKEDNISGQITVEWLLDGFYQQQRGEWDFAGTKFHSMEIVGYDPATKKFAAYAYSSMGGSPLPYYWDVQGNVVTHWTEGSKYTGTFSADGNTISGGWRPDKGVEANAGNAYDATMTRIK